MKLPQFSLRTILWLLFAVALVIGWAVDGYGLRREVTATKRVRLLNRSPFGSLSVTSTWRNELRGDLKQLTDFEVFSRFIEFGYEARAWELCLTEMARRGMVEELQACYELLQKDQDPRMHLRTPQILTALRRAQGEPDPFHVRISFVKRRDGQDGEVHTPMISAFYDDFDSVSQRKIGGDLIESDRNSGSWWQIELKDSRGRILPNSFCPYGHRMASRPPTVAFLDLRHHVQPPASGRYELRVIHAGGPIAHEHDLAGLITWKSEPMRVYITNSELPAGMFVALRTFFIACLIAAGLSFTWFRLLRGSVGSRPLTRSERILPALAILITCGWFIDAWRLHVTLRQLRPGSEATWTMQELPPS